ncbi:ATP-binding SpoIIE family protein phosphatase [Streptomyces lincolnensis]|uniref:ATP-binding SpoIIE family protein phosphatase n=1 Tax=Streptomyces lincolnensis TaxID=1915 RepID=UPI0008337A63|nr:ATP-binding SpoIIE family protein phosphatase [Streptomyces lincolnensis]QMV04607.1 SpoIIE family protein phosphatase [Streptomyces lincolnensis]QMV11718.1 SpoIIE family protein phosphatase [Streptomyces lincolnensis]
MPRVWEVPVHDSTRVRDARVAAEHAADEAGLAEPRKAAAALVATELATNLLKHAGGGQVLIEVVTPPVPGTGVTVVQIAAIDHGPGIADVAAALRDGYSTTRSLGAGLGTCRRISDDFDVHSAAGRGTVAVARVGTRHKGPAPAGVVRAGGINVPFAGAEHSGDGWAWARAGDRVTLMLADGLGHGPEAARASTAAVEALHRAAHLPPSEALVHLDTALRGTRGAAVAVAQVETRAGLLRFAGVGNIGARLWEGAGWRSLLSRPGIVGVHRRATLREDRLPWAADRMLILHSDGLPSRWTPPSDPRLPAADPAVVAAVTVRDASSSARPVRDDTAVVVLAPTPAEGP